MPPTPERAVRPLRIVVADADPAAVAFYREALPALGHYPPCPAETGRQLLDLCRAVSPDLVITADRLPDAGGPELAAALAAGPPVPVVVAVESADAVAAWAAAGCRVVGCLVKPLRADAVGATVAVAVRCAEQFRALRDEADQLRRALEERKVVERAKGLVGRYCGLGEDEAYRRLRKLATNGGKKMVDVARDVLAAGEVFARLAEDGPSRSPGSDGVHLNGYAGAGS